MTSPIIAAILPAFLVILLGFFLRSQRFPVYGFWRQAENITYRVFLPVLLFRSLANSPLEWVQFVNIGTVILLGFLLQCIVCFTAYYIWKIPAKTFAALFQGAIRFNNYIGIALVMALFGEVGITIYAVIIAVAIPVATLLTIAVMTHYAGDTDFSVQLVGKRIIRNPLVIGTLSGIAVNVINLPIQAIMPFFNILANAALPIGLMCVGAAISRQEIKNTRITLVGVTLLKLVSFPILMFATTELLGVDGLEQHVAIIFAALPCAASTTTVARQFGANVSLSANATALTTLLSLLTLPLIIGLLL